MVDDETASVSLVSVDAAVLRELIGAAVTGATADEVTPPLTPGRSWTAERVAWLRAYHQRCRGGLTGAAGEATWAVVVDRKVVGSVRLKKTGAEGVLETGIWLTRDARGLGIGRSAIVDVLRNARSMGAQEVHAQTTTSNPAARKMLQNLSFTITESGTDVGALISFRPEPPHRSAPMGSLTT